MQSREENRIAAYEKLVNSAAHKFRAAAEYDDLYQEGMIAVWKCPPDASPELVSAAVYNRMKDWVRYTKRLRHYHSVSYEEIMHDVHQ